ncbi:hypothetical protein DIURU_004875 [Diutina rugosa]|uniref:Phosphatidic acid phosphatase type 2/haloperoxidase domain-containing protein n=1 Tax=Diutina rugosa TaxID=5481 RepID=A0A642UFG9_DIURU|nr:uncharacterized protein DIURU_004875 [Diutina rugosa]KAA8898021.1 hypothetical protein DIURU_004875 [Diutina rugosa]
MASVIQVPVHLFQRYFLSEKSPGATVSDLDFDTRVTTTLQRIRHHRWSRGDVAHYTFLAAVNLFVFTVFPAPVLAKLVVLAFFALIFMIPLTSQFFFNALPILTWLALFFTCSKIPNSWKPSISVQVLPALETIVYGDNLSAVLATINNRVFDVMAWLPYGIIHFSVPFIVAALIFLFAPPTALRGYAFAFGYMNLVGVLIQLCFPAAPPWYKIRNGLEPANYSMQGSPGGLGRIDQLLGVDMYTTAFSNSPVIFGAFPSLHSGCAVMEVLFMCWVFPRARVLWWTYACWLWWSTMYLTHHYFIDLIGGAVLSLSVFMYTKYVHLPVMDQSKWCRWSYDSVTKINMVQEDPLTSDFVSVGMGSPRDLEVGFSDSMEMVSLARSRSQRTASPPNERVHSPVALVAPAAFEEASEVSSLDNSASPSVFDDYQNQISSATSVTSLEELASQYEGTTPAGVKTKLR